MLTRRHFVKTATAATTGIVFCGCGLRAGLAPGDTFTADRNTMHWMENKGTVPAVMLVTGIANRECPAPAR